MINFEINPLYMFYISAGLAAVLAAEAVYLLFSDTSNRRKNINRRLSLSHQETDRAKVLVQLRRERGLTNEGGFRLPLAALNSLIVQSGIAFNPWRMMVMLIATGTFAFGGVLIWRGDVLLAAIAALISVTLLPLLVLRYWRGQRHKKFAEQFPEAIDVIVRSLRAGHPVPIAIAMVAREMADPAGGEFGMAADEITYGADLESAMRNMMLRVGQEDLPLFITSVSIQASTGGNLSQILDNLSKVIRERFKMRRKIRGLSAEGRASAMILNLVPVVVFMIINGLSPDFYGAIWHEPLTHKVFAFTLFWMFVGNMIMRKMINFKF
jgi:tight adherence protein B